MLDTLSRRKDHKIMQDLQRNVEQELQHFISLGIMNLGIWGTCLISLLNHGIPEARTEFPVLSPMVFQLIPTCGQHCLCSLALPLASCVTSGRLLNLSMPIISSLK